MIHDIYVYIIIYIYIYAQYILLYVYIYIYMHYIISTFVEPYCGWKKSIEILHQLIDGYDSDGLSHDLYRVLTIQAGAGFRNHPQYDT